jgi:hypothetical protein
VQVKQIIEELHKKIIDSREEWDKRKSEDIEALSRDWSEKFYAREVSGKSLSWNHKFHSMK